MSLARVKAILETTTTVAVLLAAGGTLYLIASVPTPPPGPNQPVTYEVGDTFDVIPGVDFSFGPKTLVLWVQSQCKFCTDSMDFYKRLVTTERRSRIVVVGLESESILRTYLALHGVKPDQVVSVPPGLLKLRGTPTIVLVGRDRKVLDIRLGRIINPADEQTVIQLLLTRP